MNAYEYLQALRAALVVLPDDEIDNAMRYYEDYFLDAGDKDVEQVIAELGPPEQVAQAILNEYTDMAHRPPKFEEEKKQQSHSEEPLTGVPLGQDGKPLRKGISPWLLALLVLIGLPIGIPLLIAAISLVFGAIVLVVGILFAIGVCAVVGPASVVIAGIAFLFFSLFLWSTPASAITTLGAGLGLTAVGILLALLVIKLCILFIPPITRGFVQAIRWTIQKILKLTKRGDSK